ncbi:MAG: hypothetical protein HY459_03700 [Parcubacteria group bacterium]|nr:hypothetical protein [Parcubacteria group bacterium]
MEGGKLVLAAYKDWEKIVRGAPEEWQGKYRWCLKTLMKIWHNEGAQAAKEFMKEVQTYDIPKEEREVWSKIKEFVEKQIGILGEKTFGLIF